MQQPGIADVLRRAAFGLCLSGTTGAALGAILETPNWAVVGSLNASVGYDSNLTLVRGGPSAILLEASPLVTVERINSESDFNMNASARETEFAESSQPFENDYSFSANFSYPKADNSDPRGLVIVPVFETSASWVKSSQPTEFLGERVPNDVATVKGDGYFSLNGKLGVRGSAQYQSTTYSSTELNDTYIGQATAGLAYAETANSQLSFNLGTVIGHSVPNDPSFAASNVRSTEFDVTARIEGQITSKITGSVYSGFGVVRYTGGYEQTRTLPVAGADLTWGLDPRRTIVLAAYSGAEYSPNGEAEYDTRVFVSFTDVIISGWQLDLRTGPARYQYSREVDLRTDEAWTTGAGFSYQPSTRFKVYVSFDYNFQTSTQSVFKFDHEIVTLGATYHF